MLDELAHVVGANLDMLRDIEGSTRRLAQKAAVRQIIDAYDLLAKALERDRQSGPHQPMNYT
jgi:hypothetical protein